LAPTALVTQIWVLGILVPKTLNPHKTVKIAVTSIGSSLFILTVVAFITIGVLSPQEGARATFPLLTLIRSVKMSKFLERGEVLVILAWAFGLFISASTFLYCGASGLAQWFKIKSYESIVWPMAAIWVILTIHGFEDIFSLYEYLRPEIYSLYGFTIILAPLILLWSGFFIKKNIFGFKGGGNET
jgi:spore germination protein KB